VPVADAEVTGRSAQVTMPALVSKVIAPSVRFEMEVTPLLKSETMPPEFAEKPPTNVDVETVDVAVKMSATTPEEPTTESEA
jgi:hypothetical protein